LIDRLSCKIYCKKPFKGVLYPAGDKPRMPHQAKFINGLSLFFLLNRNKDE